MSPKVAIIILNWNGWQDTIECLESLYQINYDNYFTILIDNDSSDNSIKNIKQYCSGMLEVHSDFFQYTNKNKPINLIELTKKNINNDEINYPKIKTCENNLILIKNDENSGFAAGNNIGIKFALKYLEPDYILLLNNDVVVETHFLTKLVNAAELDEKIGILGPKIYYYNYKGRTDIINFLGGKIDWMKYPGYHHMMDKVIDKNHYEEIIECEWVTGAAIMYKKELPLTYLNNQYYFGCEDVDLCLNLKEEGYKISVASDSIIWHKIGMSRRKKAGTISKSIIADSKTNFRLLKNHNKLYFLIWPFHILQIFLGLIKLSILNIVDKHRL